LSEPLSLAKYPYVHGNPVNNTDPSGMFIAELNSSFAMQTILLVIAANHINSLLNNVTNTINPSIEAPLASVGNGIISIAELILSETAITACNLSKDSACSTFIPILFSGDMYKNQSIKPQGNLVDTKQKDADVRRGVPFYEWYGVVAIPGLPDSFWRHRDGRIVG
jgi:hypothetical protein